MDESVLSLDELVWHLEHVAVIPKGDAQNIHNDFLRHIVVGAMHSLICHSQEKYLTPWMSKTGAFVIKDKRIKKPHTAADGYDWSSARILKDAKESFSGNQIAEIKFVKPNSPNESEIHVSIDIADSMLIVKCSHVFHLYGMPLRSKEVSIPPVVSRYIDINAYTLGAAVFEELKLLKLLKLDFK